MKSRTTTCHQHKMSLTSFTSFSIIFLSPVCLGNRENEIPAYSVYYKNNTAKAMNFAMMVCKELVLVSILNFKTHRSNIFTIIGESWNNPKRGTVARPSPDAFSEENPKRTKHHLYLSLCFEFRSENCARWQSQNAIYHIWYMFHSARQSCSHIGISYAAYNMPF